LPVTPIEPTATSAPPNVGLPVAEFPSVSMYSNTPSPWINEPTMTGFTE
jgi:hypothetical protein